MHPNLYQLRNIVRRVLLDVRVSIEDLHICLARVGLLSSFKNFPHCLILLLPAIWSVNQHAY